MNIGFQEPKLEKGELFLAREAFGYAFHHPSLLQLCAKFDLGLE